MSRGFGRLYLAGFLGITTGLFIGGWGSPAWNRAQAAESEQAGRAVSSEPSPSETSANVSANRPSPERGEEVFRQRGCGGCHTVTGPEKKLSVTERDHIKGPTLWYAGSKFQAGYLKGWLEKPEAFRGVQYGTMRMGKTPHPALSAEEAALVAAYLESLKDNAMRTDVVPDWKKIPRRVLRRARILFQKKQPCYGCHKVKIRKTVYRRPIELGGFSAPHLIDAGLRLQPDFIVAFLKNPKRYNPNGRMPIYGDKAYTELNEKDFIALAAYISTFEEKP